MVERLRPYVVDASRRAPAGLLSVESFTEVIGPLSATLGERIARLFGVSEELSVRLERIHSDYDVASFRVRQMGTAAAVLGVVGLAEAVIRWPVVPAAVILAGAPLLAFLVLEQRVSARSAEWQRHVRLELPVVAEQLAMLLSAGYSLGAALNRLATRGRGCCAEDLRQVVGRTRQGLTEIEALREWAALVRVDALDRIIPVLALNQEASDLGRLISDEARAVRKDVQRELVETMERRGQSVWIPVTVATLVPGVIFLSIPFIEALRLFSGS
jgi:Flp pilus assembly protein TadB